MVEVLSVKVDKEKLKLLEEIAKEEQSDRSTVARRFLDAGMKEWKVTRAVGLFKAHKVSLWKAAEEAGVSIREFLDVLGEKKVIWVGASAEEVEKEAEAISRESG